LSMTAGVDVAIVGAGPYGLSLAAHLAAGGKTFRIFGAPMRTWRDHMPKGMLLKSDGFASNLSDPLSSHTLAAYCNGCGVAYHDTDIAVPLDVFVDYGLAFQKRHVPSLEEHDVVSVSGRPGAYRLILDDGQELQARRVVLAVGITHFAHTPAVLAGLPPELVSHSSTHRDLSGFRNREVAVIGAGASAVDLTALLHEAGAKINLVVRRPEVHFTSRPSAGHRSWWKRLRHPTSGLGPGLRSRLCTDAPDVFRQLPASLRLAIVRRHLGPASPWALRDRVVGRSTIMTGQTLVGVEVSRGRVRLGLKSADGSPGTIEADHIIAATGYQPDLRRLAFLDHDLKSRIRTVGTAPALSAHFESSTPGLYFIGPSAANTFGPLMRFAFGADFAARRLARHLSPA
jgi:cation diffusion facilitator CzcD-associated flavoprotein CzcO